MSKQEIKAYQASIHDYWEAGSTIVFAKDVGEAKKTAFGSPVFEWYEYGWIDIRVNRRKDLDGAYRGKVEMEWDDPTDRLAMVKSGFTCLEDTFDPDECKVCSGNELCDMYQDYLKDVADGLYD